MSQSGFIAAMLLAAFIIWLAVNDRLQTYTAVLFGPTTAPKPQGNISDQGGIIAPAAVSPGVGGSGPAGLIPELPGMSGGSGGGMLSDIQGVAGLLEFVP